MRSRKTRLAAVAGAVITAGTVAGALAATSASASTTILPRPVPHACAYDLNGGNVLDLTFQGSHFLYPVSLRVADNGLVRGFLRDNNLPVGQQVLRVHGLCIGDNALLGVNYPGIDPQGSRAENLVLTPRTGHPFRADVAGNWDETGPEQGNGTASLAFSVHRYIH